MDESARSDPQRDYSHSATLFRSLSLIALAGHSIILIAMTIVQIRPLVIINVLSVALYGGAIVLNRRRLYVAVLAVGLVEVTAHAIVATFILGWDSGFHVYLLTLLPLVFFFDPWPVRVRVTVSLERVRAVRASQSFSLGDVALQSVAEALRGTLRAQDTVARWGGEEFLLILPATDLAGARVAAEKLRTAVSEARVDLADASIHLTVTIGLALVDHAVPVADVLKRADEALYAGKAAGRDRVEVWL